MAYNLIAHRVDSLGMNGGTTTALNTVGADLIVLMVASAGTASVILSDISDSVGLTWAANPPSLQDPTPNGDSAQLFYVKNATGNANHTFTITHTAAAVSCCVAAFSGSDTSAPYDTQANNSQNSVGATSFQHSSLTPTVDNCLVLAGIQIFISATGHTISGNSFTKLDSIALIGGTSYGVGLAYVIQTTAAAISPTWSWSNGSQYVSGVCASFKAAAGGGATATVSNVSMPLTGVQ